MLQRRNSQGLAMVFMVLWVTIGCEAGTPGGQDDVSGMALERSLAATCASCHGTAGGIEDPSVPPLGGLPEELIATRMREWRAGDDQGSVMHHLAAGYTDEEFELIAGYFARLGAGESGEEP